MATIYDIARAVGVAKSTVANALSGKGTVSEATRQRILQAAQELGYRPNAVARSLYLHKTFTIALIIPNIANPFYPEIAGAVEDMARDHEYQVLLCNTHQNFVLGRQQMERFVSRWVDGYIIMGSSLDIADITQYFKHGHPIVLCDWQENESPVGIPQVSVDFYQAGELAARHLLELGHRHIAIIGDEPQQTLRQAGFRAVLENAGITLPPAMIQQGHSTLESGYAAARQLLSQQPRPTAIFATTDWMAVGAMDAVLDAGLHIPQDISIIGLDDIVVSAHVRPHLTTIAVPKLQLAKTATELLLNQFAEQQDSATSAVSHLVEPYLIVRQSTAAPISL